MKYKHQVQELLIKSHTWLLLGPALIPSEQPPSPSLHFLSWNLNINKQKQSYGWFVHWG
jgi:hypothetical protein